MCAESCVTYGPISMNSCQWMILAPAAVQRMEGVWAAAPDILRLIPRRHSAKPGVTPPWRNA